MNRFKTDRCEKTANYDPLTLKTAMGLAAPQTWVATLAPVLAAAAYSLNRQGSIDVTLFYLTLAAALLMQSSANILNDYYDYKKGTDNSANSPDPEEAILVYRCLNPGSVLALALGCLGAAGFMGLYVVFCCGPVPMGIGCIGGLVILLYSGGVIPISYLPIGELVAGFVMGGLLPLAVTNVLTGQLQFWILYSMAPLMIGIGLIMYTNNVSDIEKDITAGRRTLSVCLGRKKAGILYRFFLILWFLSVGHMAFRHFPKGFFLYPLFIGFGGKTFLKQLRLSLIPQERMQAMGGITRLNLLVGLFYSAMMLTDRCVF